MPSGENWHQPHENHPHHRRNHHLHPDPTNTSPLGCGYLLPPYLVGEMRLLSVHCKTSILHVGILCRYKPIAVLGFGIFLLHPERLDADQINEMEQITRCSVTPCRSPTPSLCEAQDERTNKPHLFIITRWLQPSGSLSPIFILWNPLNINRFYCD